MDMCVALSFHDRETTIIPPHHSQTVISSTGGACIHIDSSDRSAFDRPAPRKAFPSVQVRTHEIFDTFRSNTCPSKQAKRSGLEVNVPKFGPYAEAK